MTTISTDSALARGLSSRLHEEDVSIRTRMLELAADLDDVIHLGRGDPDFHTPEHIVTAGIEALETNKHHYTHPAGLSDLRAAIAEKLRGENNLAYGADEIVVTAGVQEAITMTILAMVEAGDEVLLSQPRYTTYDHAIYLAGGTPISVTTREEVDFALVAKRIEAKLTDASKVLVLVTPNNPTGAVTPPKEVRAIADLAKREGLLVISDEIYEKLIYDDHEHLSIASLDGMGDRTVTVNGFSKSYAMTGWRVGYVAAPAPVARRLVELRHAMSICSPAMSQYAALAALEGSQEVIADMRSSYDRRRRLVMESLDAMGFTYGYPAGAYYVYANVSRSFPSAIKFCEEVLQEKRVMIFPGALFGDGTDRYVRISLVQPPGVIEEAMDRIGEYVGAHGD